MDDYPMISLWLGKPLTYYTKEELIEIATTLGREVESERDRHKATLNIWSNFILERKKMPKCTMLVGVPASGKSTWVQEHMPMANVMSTDIVIENVARSYGMTYDEGFKELISFADKVMWRHITWSIAEQVDFVIDRTNLSAKSRKKFIDKLKLHRFDIECVVFPMPGTEKLSTEEWNRRLASRQGKTIPNYVLDSMIKNYEIPLPSEGFEKITFITD